MRGRGPGDGLAIVAFVLPLSEAMVEWARVRGNDFKGGDSCP